MKPILCILLLPIIFTIISCNKEQPNGNVLVTVIRNGTPIAQAMVYMKADTASNPGIPLQDYDVAMRCDAAGQAYFDKLHVGDYYFYTTGYSQADSKTVTGESSLKVIYRTRQNDYKISIETHL